jgi:hypothetical protein
MYMNGTCRAAPRRNVAWQITTIENFWGCVFDLKWDIRSSRQRLVLTEDLEQLAKVGLGQLNLRDKFLRQGLVDEVSARELPRTWNFTDVACFVHGVDVVCAGQDGVKADDVVILSERETWPKVPAEEEALITGRLVLVVASNWYASDERTERDDLALELFLELFTPP